MDRGRSSKISQSNLSRRGTQLAYTIIFGSYASFLFIRTVFTEQTGFLLNSLAEFPPLTFCEPKEEIYCGLYALLSVNFLAAKIVDSIPWFRLLFTSFCCSSCRRSPYAFDIVGKDVIMRIVLLE
ncbi:uncharacterized protein [Spinacia oleracea]|uniref:Uncharacterized protein LOC110790403 n=1 Tax=Spinacia oleracea TaxID=3562 RepID=A0A9R0JY81_SPIOL|nr:uncharacterized protein LOC110790403 [Spinacia oleracea]XP_021850875.1 uncharacterized protein LOC110790403 [Spinacia oleracea]